MKSIVSNLRTIVLLAIIIASGCKKSIEVDTPSDRLVNESTFAKDNTAMAAVNYFYSAMANDGFMESGVTSVNTLCALSADELKILPANSDQALQAYYTNQLRVVYNSSTYANTYGENFWVDGYSYIYKLNAAIEGISASTTLTASIKQQLLGETKFFRAFFFFYLVNLYGDVPLALSSDYTKNLYLARSPKGDVYEQIVKDLKDAEGALSSSYLASNRKTTTTERIYVNRWVATALLSRVYLYKGDFLNAEIKATELIANNTAYGLNTLDGAFLKNNVEAIWQLQPVQNNWTTPEGRYFILPSTGPNTDDKPFYLNESLVNAFEPGDQRFTKWISSVNPAAGQIYYYAYKYKKGLTADGSITSTGAMTEYSMILRVAEQYLIRAEARAQLNKTGDAQADLNIIRKRAGLSNTTAVTQSELLAAIMKERRVEFFTEWGHRWLDLKRTNTIDSVMTIATPLKGGNSWVPTQALFPISQSDVIQDPKLLQNPGY